MPQTIHQDSVHTPPVSPTVNNRPKIVFVGSAISFSERTLAVYRAEFTDYDFFRIATLAELSVMRSVHNDVQLVIFEADMMQSALDDTQRFVDAVGAARTIFSMSDPQDAARFLLARERHSGLDNVGFLPLNGPMDVWISIMYLFLCGQSFMPHEIADALINHCAQAAREDGLQPGLTTREWEVLHMVAQGAANKNIAADLDLSIHTVKLHIHNLLRKIGVSNRTCAASWFMENHSGQPDPHRGAHGGS